MGAPRAAPDGLDYVPIPGDDPNLIFGVIRATLAGADNTATEAIMKRLFPVARPADSTGSWPKPTCYRHDVTLPPWANSDYQDPQTLCRAYGAQAWAGIKDLMLILSFRFPETVSTPPMLSLHSAFERVRGYAHEKLSIERSIACVFAMHVPGRAGLDGLPPHVHVMGLARQLGPAGFGPFVRPLTTDAGRAIIEREWQDWCSDESR